MELNKKIIILKEAVGCMKSIIDHDSDDSDTDNILIALTNICENVMELPTVKSKKRLWESSRRYELEMKGSFAFLTKQWLLNDETRYQSYLRMSKCQFDFLVSMVKGEIQRCDTVMRNAIPAEQKLAVTLRYLCTGDTFKSLDYQTRLSCSTISKMIPEVCNALYKHLKARYLKFPSSSLEWENISMEFASKLQFPNCLGALDVKHITFRPLRQDRPLNFKSTENIALMALADANCKFISVDINCTGGVSTDAEVFLHSRLRTFLVNEIDLPNNAVIGNDRCLPYVVVGDGAFAIEKHLMTPYPCGKNSSDKQTFNRRLFRAQHVAEHAFEILTDRFKVLLKPMNSKLETVHSITFACFSLHNFLIESNETYYYISSVQDSSVDVNPAPSNSEINAGDAEAEDIRQQFTEYFNREGKLDF